MSPALLILALVALTTEAPSPAAAALEQAKATDKLVLLDFYTEWCAPCKKFDQDSKRNAAIKKQLESVVLVKLDAEDPANEALVTRFRVRIYPTFVLLNTNNEVVSQWTGYARTSFESQLGPLAADPVAAAQREAEFQDNPTFEGALFLARYYTASGTDEDALNHWLIVEGMNPDPSTTYLDEVVRAGMMLAVGDQEAMPFSQLEDTLRQLLNHKTATAEQQLRALGGVIWLALNHDHRERADHWIKEGLAMTENSPDSNIRYHRSRFEQYQQELSGKR